MPYDPNYVEGKFADAVAALAVSSAPIQERLRDAHGCIHTLIVDKFPSDEHTAAYRDIMDSLSVVKENSGQYLSDTLERMSDSEAERIAGMIVDLGRALTFAARPLSR